MCRWTVVTEVLVSVFAASPDGSSYRLAMRVEFSGRAPAKLLLPVSQLSISGGHAHGELPNAKGAA